MRSSADVHALLKQGFARRIPSGGDIAQRAVAAFLSEHADNPEWIKANFSDLVERVQQEAYQQYLRAESAVGSKLLIDTFGALAGPNATGHQVLDLIGANFHALDRFFLGLTQSRRPRAGSAFEYVIRTLFTTLRYPFTARADLDGSIPDYVIPSIERFRAIPIDCIVFTVKRTLRGAMASNRYRGHSRFGFFPRYD
jgi:hypothetical protein